ncbi:GNAT family N-acetyltransferase [Streptomyces sp. AC512_CC834]|uniref:GNAT family N-acetyltransferase n=1 Tax=Streptomyces sp. AC512_CC834 TaxID=2823691 RepID=UPI0027E4D813|nr:GNAT family N-acetyltransferase [Streptomyces sp. AC512_CC834]
MCVGDALERERLPHVHPEPALFVAPATQGRGIGRLLIAAAIDRARALGGARLFLGTNTKLAPAIHLYEDAGFVRITRNRLPVSDYYARADVLMELL